MQWPTPLLLTLVCFLSLPPHQVRAEMQPVPKIRMGTPPNQVIRDILDANFRDLSDSSLTKGPLITWLADCDPRLTPEMISAAPADIYPVRNLGGMLAPALAAVDNGVLRHYTPVLLITGHTGSEAVDLSLYRPQGVSPELQKTIDLIAEVATGLPQEERNPALIGAALMDRQVRQACSRYRERIATGRLAVVGAMIDIANSYGNGKGRIYLTSINGETDPARIQAAAAASALGKRHLPFIGLPPLPATMPHEQKENPGGGPGGQRDAR